MVELADTAVEATSMAADTTAADRAGASTAVGTVAADATNSQALIPSQALGWPQANPVLF
jgi:hypothetical protein